MASVPSFLNRHCMPHYTLIYPYCRQEIYLINVIVSKVWLTIYGCHVILHAIVGQIFNAFRHDQY